MAPGVPVIVLVSEKVSLPERVRYEALGFQVLSKPFPVDDLVEKVETRTLAASIGRAEASQD